MNNIIVFTSEFQMNKFKKKNPILPEYWHLDLFKNGAILQTLEMIEQDEEFWPDVLVTYSFSESNYKQLLFSMPKKWQQAYSLNWEQWENDCGTVICKADWRFDLELIETMGYLQSVTEVWTPPSTRPINNQEIINISEKLPEPIVDGLLGKGESLLLSGKAGVGKSLLVYHMAYSLSVRNNLWGIFQIPRPVTSLIIQSEVGTKALKSRLDKVLKANPDFESDRVFTLGSFLGTDCQTVGMLDDSNFQEKIKNAIYEVKADVAIIDPLISFNPTDENNNTKMRAVLDFFMDAMKETGVSVIFTHHMSKSGGTRGASAIRDWTANALELAIDRRENGEARIKVIHDKARNFPEVDPFFLTRTKDLSFELAESKATRQEDERLKCVIDVLTKAGGRIEGQSNFTELISKAKNGVQKRTAVNRIKDARDCGLILEMDNGIGNSKIFKLPEN